MKKITWGILGLGKIACKFAEAVNSIENAEFICASRNEDKAKSFSEKYGAVKYHSGYLDLVKDSDVDIVYIATPMSCHYDDIRLCLENGKNVMCEKAVTINALQWKELMALASDKDLFLMEAMWMKFLPAFLKAKEWVTSGKIGDVKAIKADFCCLNKYDESDRLYKKSLGGGALLDLGVYVITFACEFLGYSYDEIISGMKFGQSGVDFDDAIILKYKNGAFADLSASFDMQLDNQAFIIGSKGRITFGPWFLCSQNVKLYDDMTNLIEDFDGKFDCNGFEYEILEAMSCVGNGMKESKINPQSATLNVMQIMDEIRRQNGLVYEGFAYENN